MFDRPPPPPPQTERLERMLRALQIEIDLLRETAVRSETRLCKLAVHLGAEHILKDTRPTN